MLAVTSTSCTCRLAKSAAEAASSGATFTQWNIERGYKLDAVIEELRRADADIIALQEVDIGCERSGSEDTGAVHQTRGLHETGGACCVTGCECS